MADRSVRIRLDANVEGFKAGMRTAVKAVDDFEKRASDRIEKHAASINDLSNVALGAGAALTGFAGFAVKSAADFDQAMSNVQAGSMETAENMELLRQAALDAGESTVYSATESAGAIEELAKAGLSTADILGGGLSGALDLAASGGIEVSEAAEIASVAMKQFGLEGKDVAGIADNLAAGAGKAVGDVDDLGMALNQAGTVANSFGLSVDETVAGLAAFAEAGMKGSDAGTMMKTMLQQLGNPTEKSARLMEELGISVWDAQGNFIGLDGVAGELETAFAGMDQQSRQAALGVIFGADAVRGANILYAEGRAGIEEWNAAVNDQGYAAEQAALRLDNLKGDIEELGGALETAFINMGDGQQGPLRGLVQGATDLVGVFNDLPPLVQSTLGAGTGLAGLSLLAVGGLGKAVTAASDLKNSLENIGIATEGAKNKLKLLGIATGVGAAVTAAGAAVAYFASEAAEAQANADSLAATFDELTGTATAATDTMILEQLNEHLSAGDWEQLREIGYSYSDVVEAIKSGGPAYDQLWRDIENTRIAQHGWSEESRATSDAMSNTADALREVGPAYQLAAEQQAELAAGQQDLGDSAGYSAEQQQILDDAVVTLDGTIKATSESLAEFTELLFEAGLLTMSARDAQAAYHESVNEVGDTIDDLIEKHGGLGSALNEAKTDFDLTTAAGRDANTAFQDIARSGMDLTQTLAENGATQEELQASLDTTYSDLVAAAGQFGITGDAADDLAREVLGIPDGVSIETWMDNQAELQARETQRTIDSIDRDITITTRFVTQGSPPRVSSPGTRTGTVYANGGIREPSVRAFANGAENHVAQIAPAGAWRLWAEPETGGEAYIPLAASKRARSTDILADVANRFGMTLSKFDNGGMVLPYEQRRAVPGHRADVSFSPNFYNYNSDAVIAVREQVHQMSRLLDRAAITL